MANLRITVAICTHNRARLLAGALESLCLTQPPTHADWEVLVVLNHCLDDSRRVVEAFRSRLPIVLASEPRVGCSHARNRAIDCATGDVIVWIDDDVRVGKGWVCAYEQAFLVSDAADFFGGPIEPLFEGTPPDWLARHWQLCDTAFAARRVGPRHGDITRATKHRPFGANFAVRAAAQREHRYDPRLGRQPGMQWWGGDESRIIGDILAAGGRGRWVPGAHLHHVITPQRQTTKYLRSYYQSYGVRVGLRARRRASTSADLPTLADVVGAEARYRWLRAVAGPERWIPALKMAARSRGSWLARDQDAGATAV